MTSVFDKARAMGIKTVRLMIYQPKAFSQGLVESVITLETLEEFAELARQKASTVRGAEEMYGKMPDDQWQRIYLHPDPNEVDCAFCRAMSTCPAAQGKIQRTLEEGFDSIVEDGGCVTITKDTPADDLSLKMQATGFIEDWCKAVRAEVERRLLLSIDVPDYGLELGRQGPRKWKDRERAEEIIRKQFRVKVEDAYNMKLKSPTQIEELTKAKDDEKPIVGPSRWKKLQSEIERSPAKPSVKPKAVIKTPYTVPAPDAGEFAAVPDEEQLW